MAIKYPMYLDNLRFFVNPTNIGIKKNSQVAESKTKLGVIYQIWPDLPDVLDLKGIAFGANTFNELLRLKNAFEKINKLIILRYKGRSYSGFLKTLDVNGDAEVPGRFNYSFNFQCINPPHFEIQDLSIGTGPTASAVGTSLSRAFSDLSNSLASTTESIGRRLGVR